MYLSRSVAILYCISENGVIGRVCIWQDYAYRIYADYPQIHNILYDDPCTVAVDSQLSLSLWSRVYARCIQYWSLR